MPHTPAEKPATKGVTATPKQRSDSHRSLYRYVRRATKLGSYQARVPIGPTKADAVNLGLFTWCDWEASGAEWAAGRAAKEFVKAFRPKEGEDRWLVAWEVVKKLQERGIVPEEVLPRWVERVSEEDKRRGRFTGDGYLAKLRKPKVGVVVVLGPFDTPEEAYGEMAKVVEQLRAELKLAKRLGRRARV